MPTRRSRSVSAEGPDSAWLITGAGSGFGREFATQLAAQGARLVLWDIDEASLQQTQEALTDSVAHTEVVDVCDANATRAAMERSLTSAPITRLVHCAGVLRVGPAGEMSPEDYRVMMDVNYLGSVHMALAILPHFRALSAEGERSTLLLVCSVSGLRGFPLLAGYCASKFAVLGFAQALRSELQATKVDVRVLCPPPGDTPMVQNLSEVPPVYKLSRLFTAEEVVNKALKGLRGSGWLMLTDMNSKAMRWADRMMPWLVDGIVNRAARAKD